MSTTDTPGQITHWVLSTNIHVRQGDVENVPEGHTGWVAGTATIYPAGGGYCPPGRHITAPDGDAQDIAEDILTVGGWEVEDWHTVADGHRWAYIYRPGRLV